MESAVYDALWDQSLPRFRRGECEVDPLILHEGEMRMGLTLLARIPESVSSEISAFLAELRGYAPGQYFYPPGDFHLTVLSVVSCRAGFEYRPELEEAYRGVIAGALKGVAPLEVDFHGITASPGCVMVQGFALNDSLAEIRMRLREQFRRSVLPHSMDRRYAIKTAHVTVMRFQRESRDLAGFARFLELSRERAFGSARLGALEFVRNDWYQRSANTKKAGSFAL